jgi:hypothetical protein
VLEPRDGDVGRKALRLQRESRRVGRDPREPKKGTQCIRRTNRDDQDAGLDASSLQRYFQDFGPFAFRDAGTTRFDVNKDVDGSARMRIMRIEVPVMNVARRNL